MESVFQELKRAREEKGIPLAQISDITRIAEEYLVAVENGNIQILPQAYVRAFLREYADVVGLDPEEIMRKYDAREGAEKSAPSNDVPSSPPPSRPSAPAAKPRFLTARFARLALALGALGVLFIVAWNLAGRKMEPKTEEIPFQTVVTQEEQRLAPPATKPEPVSPVRLPTTASESGDSLTLQMTTTDSIWVVLVADQQEPKEYLFPAKANATWKAQNRFVLTLGNAGAAEFTLNQRKLGALGKRGTVLRDFELNRQMLSAP
jgi:cytoskeletal protein RodZ